jgi:hypothetical protein
LCLWQLVVLVVPVVLVLRAAGACRLSLEVVSRAPAGKMCLLSSSRRGEEGLCALGRVLGAG